MIKILDYDFSIGAMMQTWGFPLRVMLLSYDIIKMR